MSSIKYFDKKFSRSAILVQIGLSLFSPKSLDYILISHNLQENSTHYNFIINYYYYRWSRLQPNQRTY